MNYRLSGELTHRYIKRNRIISIIPSQFSKSTLLLICHQSGLFSSKGEFIEKFGWSLFCVGGRGGERNKGEGFFPPKINTLFVFLKQASIRRLKLGKQMLAETAQTRVFPESKATSKCF